MPNPEFVGFVNSLQATAEAALGDLNAATASAARDGLLEEGRARKVAERSLKLLTMLAEKTRGNLDFTEAELLTDAIGSLRARLGN
ncbi:DUF1844 domain-containing protein [Deinococcus metallilatus]|uniref:DUF1844 domain-containing protein n=1 Tax=Deinococcus metallilatus TaxID=1211322 RepID=A0AAJ5JXA9_9DEIO|nr:DUF1844 domain-containing protein [Deinococcus metallilatus]MBB5295340.1 hypothetical protein [Deinococcus metallilatus]QBY08507.1 DUF1844 domain-containing protein [Deinococcus metallilatus]RXJ11017.1 DUF1844 domain-containing protein [Deinococcus metallilatus]TLK21605.1 DUF1844 domain-containing protein [Deinococcus metallilatus]GMA15115.1 hypothetical protein GCM10025871_14460 [Deinococcus metallilatus]